MTFFFQEFKNIDMYLNLLFFFNNFYIFNLSEFFSFSIINFIFELYEKYNFIIYLISFYLT